MMTNSPPNDNSKTISGSVTNTFIDSSQPSPWKVVLPDECGDSLWEEALAQDNNELIIEKDSPAEASDENNEVK